MCPRFLQITVDDPLSYIQRKQLCSNCKHPSVPGLHKRSQLSHLPRSASRIAALKQRFNYSVDSILLSKAIIRLISTHHLVVFSASFRKKKSLPRILHSNTGFHIPPWRADVHVLINPTNAESAKRSILYGSATTYCGLAPRNRSRKYKSRSTAPIAWLFPRTPAAIINATRVERTTTLSYIRTTDLHIHQTSQPTILRFFLRVSSHCPLLSLSISPLSLRITLERLS